MRCRLIVTLVALALVGVVGCGGSKTPPSAASAPGTSGAAPNDPIAHVVYDFFNAVRLGQTAVAHQYLTPLSLQRINEQDMNFTPPESPTASFQVGQVTTRENDHALVSLTWTDLDVDGKPANDSIMCELRLCDGQWRICGMAQDMGPGQPPMVLDFESTEGSAPKAPTQATATAASTLPDGTTPTKQMAQDPFQQPVQR